jgi:hypothetical protein
MGNPEGATQPVEGDAVYLIAKALGQQLTVKQWHVNVTERGIVTTEAKLRACLSNHLGRMETRRAWLAPLGLLVPIVITLLTSKFEDYLLSPATWQAIFILGGVGSFIWLIIAIVQSVRSATRDDIVGEITKGSQVFDVGSASGEAK